MSEALIYEEGYREEVRTELIDGKIVVMAPRPATNHSRASFGMAKIFDRHFKNKKCEVFLELDVYLSKKDRFVPDIVVVCNPDIVKDDGIHGAPDLVVEVLSPGTSKRDKGYKKDLYEKHGVKEYWIVDIANRSIEVYLPENGKYTLNNVYTLYPDFMLDKMDEKELSEIVTKFSPSIFPDILIDLDEVFEGITK